MRTFTNINERRAVASGRRVAVPAYSPQTHPVRNRSRNDRDEAHTSWSLNIGKVAGTVVRLHITFVLLLAWIFVSNYASSGATIAWNSLLFVVLLFLCVLLHEFGRLFTARAFGVPTPGDEQRVGSLCQWNVSEERCLRPRQILTHG